MKRTAKQSVLICLLLLLLSLSAACGQDSGNGDMEEGNLVAGASGDVMYAYIREINGQARTVMLDEVELVNQADSARVSRLGLTTGDHMYGGSYVYNSRLQQRLYPLAEGLVLDLMDDEQANENNDSSINNNSNNGTGFRDNDENKIMDSTINSNNNNGSGLMGNGLDSTSGPNSLLNMERSGMSNGSTGNNNAGSMGSGTNGNNTSGMGSGTNGNNASGMGNGSTANNATGTGNGTTSNNTSGMGNGTTSNNTSGMGNSATANNATGTGNGTNGNNATGMGSGTNGNNNSGQNNTNSQGGITLGLSNDLTEQSGTLSGQGLGLKNGNGLGASSGGAEGVLELSDPDGNRVFGDTPAQNQSNAGLVAGTSTSQMGSLWDDSSFDRGIESIRNGIDADYRTLYAVTISDGKVVRISRMR